MNNSLSCVCVWVVVPRRRGRRGYPVAVLIGLRRGQAVFWDVFSESVRPGNIVTGDDVYNFFESVVDVFRPSVKRGVKIIVVATLDEKFFREFMGHIRRHQGWLLRGWDLNIVKFEYVSGEALDIDQVKELVRVGGFREKLGVGGSGDIEQVMGVLERRLGDVRGIDSVFFSLVDVERIVYGSGRPLYVLVTEGFLRRHRRRVQRLLGVAADRQVMTRVVRDGSSAAVRLAQFGGLVCLL